MWVSRSIAGVRRCERSQSPVSVGATAALAPVGLAPIKPHRIVDQKSFLQIGGRSDLPHLIDKRNVVAKASITLRFLVVADRQSQNCSDLGYLVVIGVEADIRSNRSKSVWCITTRAGVIRCRPGPGLYCRGYEIHRREETDG